ncbi:MAG TPA: IS110 family transposase [Pyrinomonadaceae bacterium]|jgi:transposase|nr:IS110 family transposase [Pyrinomonadaceae bacterium]
MCEDAALIGIDWADQKHDICLIDLAGDKREASVLRHSPQSIDEWAHSLQVRFAGRKIALCLEQSRGPLISALMKYNFFVLYPINPSTLSRYRQAFSPSRHKDDGSDAAYLAELLLSHREHLRAWQPDSEQTRTLRYLVEHRRRLVADRTRLSNRMTALLKCYFPQVLQWFPNIRTTVVCDFLLRWPSLDTLRRVRRETLWKFFRSHNSLRKETIEKRVEAIKQSLPLTTDRAVLAASVLMMRALASQMKTTLAAIHEFDAEIAALCAVNEDFALMQSLPGAGPNYAAKLTVALGTDRERWQSADELARLSGIVPVIERSGKSCRVRWRYFCPKFLRQSFHEYAGESIRHSFWARAYYEQQRAKGKSHSEVSGGAAKERLFLTQLCGQSSGVSVKFCLTRHPQMGC